MHHQRQAAGRLPHLADDVKAQLRLGLVYAVHRAKGDGQRIHAGLLNKASGILRVGVEGLGILVRHLAVEVVGQVAQLRFHGHVHRVCHADDLPRLLKVLLEGLAGGVVHHGGIARADGAHHRLQAVAMVQVHADGHRRLLSQGQHDLSRQLQ